MLFLKNVLHFFRFYGVSAEVIMRENGSASGAGTTFSHPGTDDLVQRCHTGAEASFRVSPFVSSASR